MNTRQLEKCYRAARRARQWAKKNANRYPSVSSRDLCGMCGIAAVKLLYELRKEGINAKIAVAEGHAFVEYGGHIIDVTATQFGHDPVVIREGRDGQPYWKAYARFTSGRAFMEHQREVGWGEDEIYDYQAA